MGKRLARYPFVAMVKATDLASGTHLNGITTDLSGGGCCVVTREPFSRGIQILLEITKKGISFVTRATVAYSLPGQAMGLAFQEIAPNQMSILGDWLNDVIPTMRRNPKGEQSSS